MSARTAFGIFIALSVLTLSAQAGGKADLQEFFNDAASKVKATSDPAEKREILTTSFERMSRALDMASSLISEEERIGVDRFKMSLLEKQDELAGRNGYARVPDEKLDDFSDYVVQDTEQAVEYITISVITLLLIIILIVLIVK